MEDNAQRILSFCSCYTLVTTKVAGIKCLNVDIMLIRLRAHRSLRLGLGQFGNGRCHGIDVVMCLPVCPQTESFVAATEHRVAGLRG